MYGLGSGGGLALPRCGELILCCEFGIVPPLEVIVINMKKMPETPSC